MVDISDRVSVSPVPPEGSGALAWRSRAQQAQERGRRFSKWFCCQKKNTLLQTSLSSLCRWHCSSPLVRNGCLQRSRQDYPGLLPFRQPALSSGMACGCLGGWLTRVRGTELGSASFDSNFSIVGFKRKIQTMEYSQGKKKKKIAQDEDIWIHGSSHKYKSFPLPLRKIWTSPESAWPISVPGSPLAVSFQLLYSLLKPFRGHC